MCFEVGDTSWPHGREAVGRGWGRMASSGMMLGERGSLRCEGRREYLAAIVVGFGREGRASKLRALLLDDEVK